MDVNNNLANMTLKVKCDFCEKSFFGEFLSKHMRVSHPGVERPKKKKSSETKLQPMENDYINQSNCTQCPRTNLDKRFLPRPKTIPA